MTFYDNNAYVVVYIRTCGCAQTDKSPYKKLQERDLLIIMAFTKTSLLQQLCTAYQEEQNCFKSETQPLTQL